MLDIKYIIENSEKIKQLLLRRGENYSNQIDKLVELYLKRKKLIKEKEDLASEINKKSKEYYKLIQEEQENNK